MYGNRRKFRVSNSHGHVTPLSWLFQVWKFRLFVFSLCVVAERYMIQQKCLKKWIESVLLGTRRHNFQPLHRLWVPQCTTNITDRRTEDSVMPRADNTTCSSTIAKKWRVFASTNRPTRSSGIMQLVKGFIDDTPQHISQNLQLIDMSFIFLQQQPFEIFLIPGFQRCLKIGLSVFLQMNIHNQNWSFLNVLFTFFSHQWPISITLSSRGPRRGRGGSATPGTRYTKCLKICPKIIVISIASRS